MDWKELHRRLSARTTELQELDDVEFAMLKALLPKQQRRRSCQELALGPAADTDEDRAYEWMRSQLKFNEERRQQRLTQPPTAPAIQSKEPQSREDAIDKGYVSANDVLSSLTDRFDSHSKLTTYLERHPSIRTFKPNESRKMIHAGDLLRQLASEKDSSFEGIDREGVEDRTEELKKKRQQGHK